MATITAPLTTEQRRRYIATANHHLKIADAYDDAGKHAEADLAREACLKALDVVEYSDYLEGA